MSRNNYNNQPDYRNWSESNRELNMPASELGAAAWRKQQVALMPYAEPSAQANGPSLLQRAFAALRNSLHAGAAGGAKPAVRQVANSGAAAK